MKNRKRLKISFKKKTAVVIFSAMAISQITPLTTILHKLGAEEITRSFDYKIVDYNDYNKQIKELIDSMPVALKVPACYMESLNQNQTLAQQKQITKENDNLIKEINRNLPKYYIEQFNNTLKILKENNVSQNDINNIQLAWTKIGIEDFNEALDRISNRINQYDMDVMLTMWRENLNFTDVNNLIREINLKLIREKGTQLPPQRVINYGELSKIDNDNINNRIQQGLNKYNEEFLTPQTGFFDQALKLSNSKETTQSLKLERINHSLSFDQAFSIIDRNLDKVSKLVNEESLEQLQDLTPTRTPFDTTINEINEDVVLLPDDQSIIPIFKNISPIQDITLNYIYKEQTHSNSLQQEIRNLTNKHNITNEQEEGLNKQIKQLKETTQILKQNNKITEEQFNKLNDSIF